MGTYSTISPNTTAAVHTCAQNDNRSIVSSRDWIDAPVRRAALLAEVSALLAGFAASNAELGESVDGMIRRRCARRRRKVVAASLGFVAGIAAVVLAAVMMA